MAPFFFAHVDELGRCYAVTQAAGAIDNPALIPIQSLDVSLLGMIWSGEAWSAIPVDE